MKAILFVILGVLLFPHSALSDSGNAPADSAAHKIRMSFNGHEVIVTMFDTPVSRDFLMLLPFTAEFTDYAGEEKITYLPRKLNTSGSPNANEIQGDFTYFKPWGNLAIFYKGFGHGSQLAVLGRIDSGKDKLARMSGNFTARIEKIE